MNFWDPQWPFRPDLEDDLYEAVWRGLGAGEVEPHNRCDHSLRLAKAWAEDKQMDWEVLGSWLRKRGGGCDCEILLNVVPDDEDDE